MNRLFIVDRMDGMVGTDRTGGSDGIDGIDWLGGTDGKMIFLHQKWYSWPKISTFRVNVGRSGQLYLISFLDSVHSDGEIQPYASKFKYEYPFIRMFPNEYNPNDYNL